MFSNNRLAKGVRQFSSYFAGTVLLALSSLAVVPALVSANGIGPWSAFALGQSIGAVGAVIINFGLTYAGPSVIAGSTEGARRGYLVRAVRVQVLALILTACTIGVGLFLWSPHDVALLVFVGVLQQALYGFSASWYLVGLSRPGAVFLADIAPRVIGNLTAIALVYLASSDILLAGSVMAAGVAVAATTTIILAFRNSRGYGAIQPTLRIFLRDQATSGWANLLDTTARAAPVLLVGSLFPGIFAAFAFYDKVYRQGVAALTPVVQVLQPWVARANAKAWWGRVWTAHAIGGSLVVLAIAGGVLVGVPLLDLLGAGEVNVSQLDAILLAAAVALWVLPLASIRVALIPLKDSTFVSLVAPIVALASVVLTVGGASFGVTGALGGVVAGLLVLSLTYMSRVLVQWRKARRAFSCAE